jgi:hypothetical protein
MSRRQYVSASVPVTVDGFAHTIPTYVLSSQFLVPSPTFFHRSTMPNQHKPCRLLLFHVLLANSSHIKLVAPLALVETDIRRLHSQGFSIVKMVHVLRKHYDTDMYGIG